MHSCPASKSTIFGATPDARLFDCETRSPKPVPVERVRVVQRIGIPTPALHGGKQKRVAIAHTVANALVVVLADDPTGTANSATARDVIELPCLLGEDGKIVLVVTQHEGFGHFADRTTELAHTRLVGDSALTPRAAMVTE